MDRNALQEKDIRRRGKIRVYYDMVMGVLWLLAGFFFIVNNYVGKGYGFDAMTATLFGVACLLYGSFRLYRATKAKKQL